MADISQEIFSSAFFSENCILIQLSLNHVPSGPLDIK